VSGNVYAATKIAEEMLFKERQKDMLPLMEQMAVHASDAAGLMKALGNESRLMILCALASSERSVGELNEIVPLSQSALSQQLARLRQQGLVTTRRESQTIFYSLTPGPADRIINVLHDIYCGTADDANGECS
jgi:DNA-binding transcriptional ArsR family regulator